MGDSKISKNNLARIRDNQRRSRARRKEYLQELEAKYRSCQQLGIEASAEVQAAARKVLDENKRLRTLLWEKGVPENEINAYLHASAEGLENHKSTSALQDLLSRRIPFPGENNGIAQDWTPPFPQNTLASSQTPKVYTPSLRHDDTRSGSPHSNPSPISVSDTHSTTYSPYSAHAEYSEPTAYAHLPEFYLTSSPWQAGAYNTPQSQLGYASSLSRVSSSNLISATQSEIGMDLETNLPSSQPGSESMSNNLAAFELGHRYHGNPYGP